MTLVSLKSGTENGAELVKIALSDGSSLSFKVCFLSKIPESPALWEEGREISPAEEEDLRFATACYRAERVGLRLIARAEQSEMGLFRKLEYRGHSSAGVSAVISRFVSQGLVNDERYAERWVRARLVRRGGKVPTPRNLSAALRNRGISAAVAGEALKNCLDTETELALIRRYLNQHRPSFNFSPRSLLKFEGFSPAVISLYFDE
jgi:regulatory protein